MNNAFVNYVTTENVSVIEAMQLIDKGAKGIVFVVDENESLIGCVTDGDIRRWLIKTADLSAKVSEFMYRSPKYIFLSDDIDRDEYMERFSISALPVLNADMQIVDITFRSYAQTETEGDRKRSLNDVDVVIMAGGKGTRLYPYTKILPKPLIPIGEIPIIERIIDKFTEYGINDYYLTVNYKKGMIKSYFNDLNPKYNIHYVEENKPLGTGGSLRLIDKKFDKPVFVTNCDILVQANLADIYNQHIESGNAITIVSSLKNVVIPYGVLKVKEEGVVEEMQEKPSMFYFINTGMYIVNPELIELIPEDTFYHMPQLADECIRRGMKVGMYPISEDAFLDMGEFEEMKRMEEKLDI